MSSGSYYEEEMSSGGHRRLTAFILWPFPLSKKSPLDPPSPWSWLGAYGNKTFCSSNIYFCNHAVIDVREIVPAVGVAKGIGGLPFTLFRAVVAEEEGVAKLAHQRLPGEECLIASIKVFAECGQVGSGEIISLDSKRRTKHVVEHYSRFGSENRIACGNIGYVAAGAFQLPGVLNIVTFFQVVCH